MRQDGLPSNFARFAKRQYNATPRTERAELF
jgi:hypothetical protein